MDRYVEHRLRERFSTVTSCARTVGKFGYYCTCTASWVALAGAVIFTAVEPVAFTTFMGNLGHGFNDDPGFSEMEDEPVAQDIVIRDPVREAIAEAMANPMPIIKAPTNRAIMPQTSTSVGAEDQRVDAYVQQSIFDPVGLLNNECTETYVTIPNYQVIGNDALIVTAAHCLEEEPDHMAIQGDFYVASDGHSFGHTESYQAIAQEVWVHPFYDSYRAINGYGERDYSPYDIALIRVRHEDIPADVTPAILHPIDFSRLDRMLVEGLSVTSVGYSADRYGLTYHPDCQIVDYSFADFKTDCDIAGGASGGNFVLPFNPDVDEQLQILGINGGTQTGTEYARHSFLEGNMLSTIPFVVPIEENHEVFCARVDLTSGNLHRRFAPSIEGARLSVQEQEHFGALPNGTLVQVFGSITTPENGSWDFIRPTAEAGVELIDQSFGYSSAEFLTSVPCSMTLNRG